MQWYYPLPVAIPIAFASHLLLDALPHFGFTNINERRRKLKLFRWLMILDIALAIVFSAWLIKNHHTQWCQAVGLVGLELFYRYKKVFATTSKKVGTKWYLTDKTWRSSRVMMYPRLLLKLCVGVL